MSGKLGKLYRFTLFTAAAAVQAGVSENIQAHMCISRQLEQALDLRLGGASEISDVLDRFAIAEGGVSTVRALLLDTGDFQYSDLLKETLPGQEWNEALESLVDDLKETSRAHITLPEIYAREEMWKRLLESALQAGESMLKRYRDLLEPRFPEQVCKTCEGIVYERLQHTSSRGVYADAAEYLLPCVCLGAWVYDLSCGTSEPFLPARQKGSEICAGNPWPPIEMSASSRWVR